MRKLLALSFVVVMVVGFAGPTAADEGFVLFGADAAYVDFHRADGCDAFIGFVDAKGVKYFDGPVVMPHADVEVKLSGTCGTSSGLVNISGGHPDAELVKLESATLDEFVIDDAGFYAVIDLTWTAVGHTYTEVYNETGMRAAHRTRDVIVTGTLWVDGVGEFTAADFVWGKITHYSTVVSDNLP